MIRTEPEAYALLEKSKVMALTASGAVPSLVVEVAGKIKGSWWAHPKGGTVFQISEGLADREDVLVVKLVAGKVTFVHRALWPALLRAVSDSTWRDAQAEALTPQAKRLLARVEEEGEVRLDEPVAKKLSAAEKKARTKTKDALEKSLLVLSQQEHTERGSHATVLRTWKAWARAAGVKAAAGPVVDARRAIADACRGQPTALDD